MSAGEGKIGGIMVKAVVRIARWVAGQAGRILIIIPAHPGMLLIRFGINMAIGAPEFRVIR